MGYVPSLYTATQAILSISALTVCTAATLLYRYQGNLVYPSNFPTGSRTEVLTPDHFDIEYDNLTLQTPDGESLHAFLMPQRQISEKERARGEREGGDETMGRRPTVLVFHANAGNMVRSVVIPYPPCLSLDLPITITCSLHLLRVTGFH